MCGQVELSKREQYQLPGMLPDQTAWQKCPCCWRTCQALMGDACLGITRLRAAASSSHALAPFESNGSFIDDKEVQRLLVERQKLDSRLLDAPACVDFKAAMFVGKLSPGMDTTGMAALVCRHEFVAVAVNMFTPENFCYYDIRLERMQQQYSQDPDRQLVYFFLDIACQFQGHWNRYSLGVNNQHAAHRTHVHLECMWTQQCQHC